MCRGLGSSELLLFLFFFLFALQLIDEKKTLCQSILLFTLNPSHMFALPTVDSLVR